ncbi:hypothetical protein [Zoogloea sp.]|uniref:hypothetical protein n=1 Tax=Zoogloea sp. TaxID=49181 RepID=UPI0025D501A1|nr:hypothetical protein [Zoogloea sp.]
MGDDIQEALDVMGPRFVQIYGQGESPMTITALSRGLLADRTDPAWAQRRLRRRGPDLVDVRIVDREGAHPCPMMKWARWWYEATR